MRTINYKQCNLNTITWKSQLNKSHSRNNYSNLCQQSNLRLYSTLYTIELSKKDTNVKASQFFLDISTKSIKKLSINKFNIIQLNHQRRTGITVLLCYFNKNF